MELNVLKNVERKKNLLMFIVNVLVPIAALLFVMLFLKGTVRDVSVVIMSLAGVMVRLFEEKLVYCIHPHSFLLIKYSFMWSFQYI